ncbi:MAG: cupin domain-containing protein [Gammaproteobacteria bacterium]|nr:cupin domain-containing protein [Gammaproteobacteria bacterium]MYC25990.1 cupin domain-containing protein [Gammaproteobacteria bacterium]
MSRDKILHAMRAEDVRSRPKRSNYPEPFKTRVGEMEKRPLGNAFGLRNFGVNLSRLPPGSMSALMHTHSKQDELVYVLQGEPTLVKESTEIELKEGMCCGFPAKGEAHHLVNRSEQDVLFLEIGDRTRGDEVCYPLDDLKAGLRSDGKWGFSHKDGTPYD